MELQVFENFVLNKLGIVADRIPWPFETFESLKGLLRTQIVCIVCDINVKFNFVVNIHGNWNFTYQGITVVH